MLCVFWLLHQSAVPSSLSLSRASHYLRHNSIEIRPINNPTSVSECTSERKCCTFLTLNQKLEMIKLSKEGMSKAERGHKLCLLPHSQVVNANEKFLKKI